MLPNPLQPNAANNFISEPSQNMDDVYSQSLVMMDDEQSLANQRNNSLENIRSLAELAENRHMQS